MKWIKYIGLAVLMFSVGYYVADLQNNDPIRQIRIGYQNSENPDRVDYTQTFDDRNNETIAHNIMMIYLNREKITDVNVDLNNPDVYIDIMNPQMSVGLIDSRLWFTDEGAIIANRSGETWDEVDFYQIDTYNANYIKETIGYQ